jgi:phytanoyl-CoA hydroxylase
MPIRSPQFDLRADGFTILRAVYCSGTIAAARQLVVEAIKYAERGLEDPFYRYYLAHRPDQGVLFDVLQRHPLLWELAMNSRVLDAMASELGDDIYMYENSIVYKPKGRRNGVPYHQDFISRPDEPLKLISWTALEPITVSTGAMKLLPGSHSKGFLPWHRIHGETHHDRIDPAALPAIEAVHAELEAGDVLVFNQLLVHGSDEVHTDALRIALRISYQGFDAIHVPRGSPIVVRGGAPDKLASRFPHTASAQPRLPLWRRGLRFMGRKLAAI